MNIPTLNNSEDFALWFTHIRAYLLSKELWADCDPSTDLLQPETGTKAIPESSSSKGEKHTTRGEKSNAEDEPQLGRTSSKAGKALGIIIMSLEVNIVHISEWL